MTGSTPWTHTERRAIRFALACGRELRAIREEQGLPAATIARRMGITPETLNDFELGRYALNAAELYQASRALETSLLALINRADRRARHDPVIFTP